MMPLSYSGFATPTTRQVCKIYAMKKKPPKPLCIFITLSLGKTLKKSLRRSVSDHTMKTKAMKRPHFFKFLQEDFEQRLRIPPAFVEHLKNDISELATLVGPSGSIWHSKVHRSNNEMYLEEGWDIFTKDHSLIKDELLVLRYDGNTSFSVKVFGRNTCEREDALTVTADFQGGQEHDEAPKANKKKRGRPPKIENRSPRTSLEPNNNHAETDSMHSEKYAHAPCPLNGLHHAKDHRVHEGKCLDQRTELGSLKESTNGKRDENSGGPPKNFEGRKRGRPRKIALEPNRQSKSLEGNTGSSPKLDNIEKNEGIDASSRFPTFNIKMQVYNVKPPFYMPFPSSFVKRYLPRVSQGLILLHSNGKEYPVSYVYSKIGSGLTTGWDVFSERHNLEVDDTCAFELIEADKLCVRIFRSGRAADQDLCGTSSGNR